jgi:hypothetical protein
MEPTADELNQIDTLQAAYDWAGVPEDVRESLKEALGEPSKIRDIIFVARAVWDTIVGRIKGSKPPDADGNRDPRDLTPVDVFRLEIFRRVCFRRVGAQPDTPGSFGPAVPAVTAATPASITGQPSGRKLKMSAVVDQTLDAEVIALGTDAINKMYEAYRAKYGDVPSPETEPTGDQLAAVHQLVASGATPYIDFAVYGPSTPWASGNGAEIFRCVRTTFLLLETLTEDGRLCGTHPTAVSSLREDMLGPGVHS